MKKIAFSALLAATLLGASEYNFEISPMAGYAFPSGQHLDDHGVYGAEFQYNGVESDIKPELSVLYSNADYDNSNLDTDIFRMALNGVYNLTPSNGVTPFVKAGLGYETMSEHAFDNHNSAFADAGAGLKIALAEQVALKLEAIDMVKFNNYSWDNNLLIMAGLSFAFGEKAQPAAPVAAAPEPKHEPVAAPAPKPAPIPAPKPVVAAPIDSDKDGVFDPQDKCPNTPAGFKVDVDGCPLKATLHLNFSTDSAKVDAEGTAKVNEFAAFLKESPAYKANIVGHTDSTGSDKHNQKLSEKRAEKVKAMLVEDGVAAERLTSEGMGEKMPVATNKTKAGRAENRRIEVELCQ
ncbi:OmpA family protein [Sulfuricurvum sp.]|uniref:OmpA family protein n=1 Tax=Sulfuricurvum sp. TaxID=2025608 RepID=UPI0026374623|nr:OmpA family protein [Sulfuricurvum sp.]MDD4883111.1 OmpA family protein [Sulfuricurvum sp.]